MRITQECHLPGPTFISPLLILGDKTCRKHKVEEGVPCSTVEPHEVSVLTGENGKLGKALATRRSWKEYELWTHVDAGSWAGRQAGEHLNT